MTVDTTADTRRGRPRSEGRTEAIVEATGELMEEVGYDNLRVQDVAERAGVGLATIYRRWPTKEDLVAAAIRARPAPYSEPTGDPRTDLHDLIRQIAGDLCHKSEYMAGFMVAARDHAVLGEAVRSSARDLFQAEIRHRLVDYVGQECAHLDFVCDAIAGTLLYRTTLLLEDVDPDQFADEILTVADSLRST